MVQITGGRTMQQAGLSRDLHKKVHSSVFFLAICKCSPVLKWNEAIQFKYCSILSMVMSLITRAIKLITQEWCVRNRTQMSYIRPNLFQTVLLYTKLEGTARYAGLLLAPVEGFGLRPRHLGLWLRHFGPLANSFLAFGQGHGHD